MYALIFLVYFVFAQDALEYQGASEAVSGEQHQITEQPSPFAACNMRQSSTGQPKVSWWSSRVPQKDLNGNKTRDFFIALHKKIEGSVKTNVELSRQVQSCFRPPYAETAESHCQEMRMWVDPKKYPPKVARPAGANLHQMDTLPVEDSLSYNIKKARAHLALASLPLKSAGDAFKPNTQLRPLGHKAIPWQPLSDDEFKKASQHLAKYKKAYLERHTIDLPKGKNPIPGLEQLLDYYENPETFSLQERDDLLKRQGPLTFAKEDLMRQLTTLRAKHLEEYRSIVSKYPIINYLSSANPSIHELQTAGLRMSENAIKELKEVDRVGNLVNNPRHADDIVNNRSVLDLMDYRVLVEELLTEHPDFCAVATTAELQREKRDLQNGLIVFPVLAASFFVPIGPAVALALAASSASAYSSYQDYKDQQQAVYSAPINTALRADQSDIDAARKVFYTDIKMLPVDVLMSGALSVTGKIRRAKNVEK
jgi:hypothetical protein